MSDWQKKQRRIKSESLMTPISMPWYVVMGNSVFLVDHKVVSFKNNLVIKTEGRKLSQQEERCDTIKTDKQEKRWDRNADLTKM